MSVTTEGIGVVQGLLARFASQAGLWQRAVKSMAVLDALMALAYAAQFGGDGAPMCRPTFVQPETFTSGSQHTAHVRVFFACHFLDFLSFLLTFTAFFVVMSFGANSTSYISIWKTPM